MKTALFLGAGASVFAKMPTTKGLVDAVLTRVNRHEKWEGELARHLARNIVDQHSDKDIEELYQTIRNMIDAEKLHATVVKAKDRGGWKREIRTTPEHRAENTTSKDEAEDIDETIRALESLETAIRNTLLTSLMVKPDSVGDVVSTYGELFKFVPLNVVTTNYDNVLETYCEQKELELVNGFKKSHLGDRRTWDDAWEGKEAALRLTKLHGSITWQEDDGGAVLEIGKPGLRDTDRDVMIAPTLGEKDYSNRIFPTLMDRFKTILAETEVLIVVGFSFRDPRINRMLRDRIRRTDENPNPIRLLHVDPEPDGLKELVGRDVEPSEEAVRGKCVLWDYSRDEMPYVCAYRGGFGPDTVRLVKLMLEAMDVVCGA